MEKRGQITVFIIIAIILLIGVSIYSYTQREVVKEEYIVSLLKEVPEGAIPVVNYVQDCLKEISRAGLKQIGSTGGYIDVSAFKHNPASPTEGEAIQFAPDSDFKIPYWWHMDSKNDCEKTNSCSFKSGRPHLYKSAGPKSIEQQLDIFINQNINSCLRNFASFDQQGISVRSTANPETNTRVTQQGVTFFLNLPLEIRKGEATYDVDQFFYEEPLQLREIYEVASEIVNAEMNKTFLEKHIINVLALRQGLDKQLPPFSALDMEIGAGKMWVEPEVKELIRNSILPDVQLYRVGNVGMTQRVPTEDTEFPRVTDTIFNYHMIVPLRDPHPSLGATFTYLPIWKPYLDLNCEGEICTSESLNIFFMAVTGIQRYRFAYDISFPVLVQVFVPSAFEASGYTFQFFLEANIRNNIPIQTFDAPFDVTSLRSSSTNTLVCNPRHRTSGEVTVNVKSGLTKGEDANKPVADAVVSYICGTEICAIGTTNSDGELAAKFPRCAFGALNVVHPDYTSTTIDFSILDDEERSADIILEPFRKINLSVRKRIVNRGGYQAATQVELSTNDEAFVILTKQIKSPHDQPMIVFGNIVGNKLTKYAPCTDKKPKKERREIEIIPGRYDVTITLMSYEDMKIPEDTRKAGSWPMEEKYTIPEVVFGCETPFPMGSAQYTIDIQKEDLDGASELILFAPAADLAGIPEANRKIEDMNLMEIASNAAILYPSSLVPIIR